MSYPTSIDSIPEPSPTSPTNNPSASGVSVAQTNAIVALETKLGTGASTPVADTLLRGTGTGTTTFAQANLTTDVTGTLPVANGGTGNTTGTATVNANLTGVITSVGNATSIASQTGTGSKFVVDTSPTLITPNLGTPSAGVATNLTGTASGLTAGNVTTNANLTGPITSSGNATAVTTNAITAPMLATTAITLGYNSITTSATSTQTSFNSSSYLGLAKSVTIPAGGRNVRITVNAVFIKLSAGPDALIMGIFSGASAGTLTTQVAEADYTIPGANYTYPLNLQCVLVAPSAGAITYSVAMYVQTGTGTMFASSTLPAYILVEAI